jgi:hypothetical protein
VSHGRTATIRRSRPSDSCAAGPPAAAAPPPPTRPGPGHGHGRGPARGAGPPARAEDPSSLDSAPTVQPSLDAAAQPPTGLAHSDLRGESDPAPDEPAADAAGGWNLYLEALVSDATSSAISPSQGPPPPPVPAPVADRDRDTRQATPAPRGPAAPNLPAGAADQATSQPATTSLLDQAEQLAHQLDLDGDRGEDDPHTPTQPALAMPTDRGDGPRRDRSPGPDRSGRLDNPTAPAQPLPVPSASLPDRIDAARRAIRGQGAYHPQILQAWYQEALRLQPQVAGSPHAATVDNLLDRISRQLRRLSRPPDAAAAAAAVPVAQPLPNPSASLPERILAADRAIRSTGIYFPQTLRAWHLEALQLQPQVVGSPDAAIVNDLQQRIWDRLSSRALANTADTVAAAQPLPNPSASLPDRIDVARRAIRSQGAYPPEILQAWHQEALRLQQLQRQVGADRADINTVRNLYQRVWSRLRPPPDAASGGAGSSTSQMRIVDPLSPLPGFRVPASAKFTPLPGFPLDDPAEFTELPGFRVPASAEFTPLPGFPLARASR